MHFGHPRTITAFKNPNFPKKFGFSGFPVHQTWYRFGHFDPILGVKFSKPLKKNGQVVLQKI